MKPLTHIGHHARMSIEIPEKSDTIFGTCKTWVRNQSPDGPEGAPDSGLAIQQHESTLQPVFKRLQSLRSGLIRSSAVGSGSQIQEPSYNCFGEVTGGKQ
jgi:hypothetical protein